MSKPHTTNETASQPEARSFSTFLWVFGSLILSLAVVFVCILLSTSPSAHQSFPHLFGPTLAAWFAYLLVGGLLLSLQASRTRLRDGVRLLAAGMPLYMLMVWSGFCLNAGVSAVTPSSVTEAIASPPSEASAEADAEEQTDPVEDLDDYLARLHTPTRDILNLAAQIPAGEENMRAAALKAIAERRFEDAAANLDRWAAQEADGAGEELSGIKQVRAELHFYAGHYNEAIQQYRDALKADADNPILLNGLACSLQQYGQYREAETAFKQAIEQAKAIWEPEDPDLLTYIAGLGALYTEMERYTEAETLLKQAREVRERTMEADNPDIARSLVALGNLYESSERYAEAEPLYLRAIALQEQVLGHDFPETVITREDLGLVYYDMGRYEEAEQIYRQAIPLLIAYYGDENPELGASYINLAVIRDAKNDYAEAERLYKKGLKLETQALAPDAPNLATDYHDLGALYTDQGRNDEAETCYKHALGMYAHSLGSDSPALVMSLDGLANLYYQQDRFLPALSLYQHSLAITEKSPGSHNAELTSVLDSSANCLRSLGRNAEAALLEARIERINASQGK